jgi:uncharacterized membrane protein YbhN (UPF0104 family)
MDRSQLIILITLVVAIAFSGRTTQTSIRREKIHGDHFAKIFHFIAVTAYLGVLPSALLGSIFVGPLRLGLPLALIYLFITLIALFLYAIRERAARASVVLENRGWTEQDARSSGL